MVIETPSSQKPKSVMAIWLGYALFVFSQGLLVVACLSLGMFGVKASDELPLILICGATISLIADVFLYRTLRGISQGALKEAENRTLRELQVVQEQQSSVVNHMIDETMSIRVKNHQSLLDLRLLIRQNPVEAQRFLDGLLLRQKDEKPRQYCGNLALNAAVYSKALTAQEREIELVVDIRLPSVLPFNDVDLVGVVSNLLENALEACAYLPDDAKKSVQLCITSQAGYLTIRCMNPCMNRIRFKRGLPQSDKRGLHGIGSISVQRTVRRYGGQLEFTARDGEFIAMVYLPLAESSAYLEAL